LGEHQLDKLGVTGSSPVPPTSESPAYCGAFSVRTASRAAASTTLESNLESARDSRLWRRTGLRYGDEARCSDPCVWLCERGIGSGEQLSAADGHRCDVQARAGTGEASAERRGRFSGAATTSRGPTCFLGCHVAGRESGCRPGVQILAFRCARGGSVLANPPQTTRARPRRKEPVRPGCHVCVLQARPRG
jgi:hypothetical protein